MSWISIDFGTSSSAAAVMVDDRPMLVKPEYGDGAAGASIFKTVAYVSNEGKIYSCQHADLMRGHDFSRYLKEFKLEMNEGCPPGLNVSYTDVVSSILSTLKNAAHASYGCEVENVLLTIPALYGEDDERKRVMSEAARRAGFNRIEFLYEAQSAAVYFDYVRGDIQDGISLIYDLGAGTFDPSLIRHAASGYEILGNGGGGIDVGGKFFTEKIVNRYKTHIDYQPNEDIIKRARMNVEIIEICSCVKNLLSFHDRETIADGFTLTREEFEGDIKPDLQRTFASCDRLLEECGKNWTDVNFVLLIGGSCIIPCVRNKLQQHILSHDGHSRIIWREDRRAGIHFFDPQFAVALGGAIYAQNMFSPLSIGYIQYSECGERKNFMLSDGENKIGRSSDNNNGLNLAIKISLDSERSMSRRHCSIKVSFNERERRYDYSVVDHSANGTYVNGQRITQETTLASNDKIKIGEHTLELFFR